MFRQMTNQDLAHCVETNGPDSTLDFWDMDGNQTAFGAPDHFDEWVAEVQRRLLEKR